MPNFKEFIKGFEEKPEQPKTAPKSDGFGGITQEPNKTPLAHTSEELKKMEAQRNAPKTYVQEQPKPQPKEEPKNGMYDKGQAYYYGRTGDMVDLGGKKYRISTKDDGTGKIGYSDTIYLKDESGKLNKFPKEQFIKEAQLLKPEPKQGSFEQAFGENQPREEFSQEDKAALVATYGAFPEEGIVARKLPNGNYLTNILSGPDTEPEEVDEETLSKVFDELRGEKGFEETINEWRENPNLIRERRNVQ